MVRPEWIIDGAWIAFCVVWLVGSFTAKRTARRQPAGSLTLQSVLIGLAFFLLVSRRFTRFGPLDWHFERETGASDWAGAVLTVVGIGLTIWARFYIGGNWSGIVTLKEGHQLVRTGPYSFVRHPIYSGLLLAMLGDAIYKTELRGLVACGIALATWKWKSLLEERLMVESFGAEYRQYRRDVKALIPYVW